jgi:transcriptional regulator with XRE-family HTH domain
MTLLRRVLGETLRGQRLRQRRTLREVSGAARVSLGYLSEVERGQKEASSELLASICDALDVRLSEVLREVSDTMRRTERANDVARVPARQLVPAGAAGSGPGRPPVPAELPVDLDLPTDLDRADFDRTDFDGAEPADPAAFASDGIGADGFDPAAFDPDQFDPEQFDPDRFDMAELEAPSELDQTGLDGVDLAELETGDGLGDVDALLSLTELSCPVDRTHGTPACLAGAAA